MRTVGHPKQAQRRSVRQHTDTSLQCRQRLQALRDQAGAVLHVMKVRTAPV